MNHEKKSKTPIAFFHYWKAGEITYQGYITHLKKDLSGECRLFSWLTGEATETIQATRAFFDDCTFYNSDYEMNAAYAKNKTEEI